MLRFNLATAPNLERSSDNFYRFTGGNLKRAFDSDGAAPEAKTDQIYTRGVDRDKLAEQAMAELQKSELLSCGTPEPGSPIEYGSQPKCCGTHSV